jgi:DNA-damage-inducible protein J
MDEDLKKSMEHTRHMLGMTMTAAFTIFAEKASRRIPFEASVDTFCGERDMADIDEAARRIEQVDVAAKTLEELAAMEHEQADVCRKSILISRIFLPAANANGRFLGTKKLNFVKLSIFKCYRRTKNHKTT